MEDRNFISSPVYELEKRIEVLEEKIQKLESKGKKKKEPTDGSKVWKAYSMAIKSRYGNEPVRNAKINRMCSDLAKRLGVDTAMSVVAFYVTQNEFFYTKNMHPLSACLAQCESIYMAWKKGAMVSRGSARKMERQSDSINASKSYLERKHGNVSE